MLWGHIRLLSIFGSCERVNVEGREHALKLIYFFPSPLGGFPLQSSDLLVEEDMDKVWLCAMSDCCRKQSHSRRIGRNIHYKCSFVLFVNRQLF